MNTVALLFLCACMVLAQNPPPSLVGLVSDAGGDMIPSASITVVQMDSNQRRRLKSGRSGDYHVAGLGPGVYSLEVKHEGFRTYKRPEVLLEVDQQLRIDVRLDVGATTESITITERAPVLNTENGTRGDVTTNEELKEMPLAGRNFADLALLTGGVVPKAEDTDGSFAINGARADNVGYLLDGVNIVQRRNTGSMVSPAIEGIQEFKMITSGFAAEFGRYAGGVLSVVLKSGGNRFRGSLYEFMRNDVFDARNFFDLAKSKLRRHQYGATVTGPVAIPKLYNGRNKTFFLFSWESVRQIQGSTRRSLTPLPEFLTGNFAQALDGNGRPLTLFDPLNRNAPFAGNRIPSNRIDPVSAKLAGFYAKPNLPGLTNNYVSQANASNNSDNFTITIDQNIRGKDLLSGRVVWRPNQSFDPFTRSFIPVFGATTKCFDILSALRYTMVVAPNPLRGPFGPSSLS